jgi:bifunctional non-homologous end joining protein LigD
LAAVFLILGLPSHSFSCYLPDMLLRERSVARPSGFVEPCRPSRAPRPPSGPDWVHEIKHDGFRLMVRREGSRVRLFTRGGHDWADRFPAIVEAASRLHTRSFLIDGAAVVCRDDGVSDFDALRSRRRDHDVTLIAFDLIEFQVDDLRNQKLVDRKERLAKMLARGGAAITYNEHLAHDGAAVFEHACRLGLEGIVSKRLDSPYRSGPSKVWLKSKNPQCEAVQREREEDWNS